MHNLTDMGKAERLIERHGKDLRYVMQWGWMVYNERKWVRDESKDANLVIEKAKETVRAMYAEASEIAEDEHRRPLLDHARQSEAAYRIKNMVQLAQSDPRIRAEVEDFDSNSLLFNVANGTVDLSTSKLLPHDRDNLITCMSPIDYIEGAYSEEIMSWLLEIANNDVAFVEYILRVFGYSLTGLTREHKVFIPYGTGRNGKSTLFNLLEAIAGDYAATAEPTLILKRGEYGTRTFDMAPLAKKRIVLMSEPESGKKLEVGKVKALSGGDTQVAEFKYGTRFNFKPPFKLFLYTNDKPEVEEQTTAIWQRLKLLPFNVSFAGREDTGLEDKLKQHLPAFLSMVVQASKQWLEEGLNEPACVTEASKDYQEDEDVLADFMHSKVVSEKDARVGVTELYEVYTAFLGDDKAMIQKDFSRLIEQHGYKKHRISAGQFFYGIKLNSVLQEAEQVARNYTSGYKGK